MNHAQIVVGLGFGDEGKGSMVDWLCATRSADLVIRYNGGSQAAHNVVVDGKYHCFQQIGSGAFAGARTLLSRYMMVNPIALAQEVCVLSPKLGEHALNKHYIDARAPIITPYHVIANKIKEKARGDLKHGSCGAGIGELGYDLANDFDVLTMGNARHVGECEDTLAVIYDRKKKALGEPFVDACFEQHPRMIAEAYRDIIRHFNIVTEEESNRMIRESNSVFEGAQGVLLDEAVGFHPHTTWSKITPENAYALLKEAGFNGSVETIGTIRSYGTRHGVGPFVAEDADFNGYAGEHNGTGEFQGSFRKGWFDVVMLKYAIVCMRHSGGIDSIALTHLDALWRGGVPWCDRYYWPNLNAEVNSIHPTTLGGFTADMLEQQAAITKMLTAVRKIKGGEFHNKANMISMLENWSSVPVRYVSHGPTRKDKERKF